jgi:anti-sigma factor RsiW
MNEQQQPERNKTCLEAGQLIAWRDGALPVQEADEVLAHLAVCAHCTAEDRALMRDRRQVFDLLSRVDPPPSAHAEPAAALARFQERLTARSTGTFLDHYDGNIHPVEFSLSRSESHDSMLIPVRLSTHRHGLGVLAQTLVAALVIAALLGTILLLLKPWLPSTSTGGHPTSAPAIGPVGAPMTVHTQAQGLEMTMRITPGPYFLSEMLEVDLSLTNHTHTTFQGDACHYFPKIIMIDGENPHDTNLASALATTYTNQCFFHAPIFPLLQLQPTKTITVQRYVALTSSGHVTLTARESFQKTALGQDGRIHIVPTASPLDGHWPSLQISVSAQVPSDRMLSLRQQDTQVIVDFPPAARGQLLYAFAYVCGLGSRVSETGSEFRADYRISLPTMTLQKPQCRYNPFGSTPSQLLRWTFVVGVPGYAMVSGKYPS